MKSFKDLTVWEKSHELVQEVYRLTSSFPESEKYGLTSQIKRSVISIPSNIAEGCGRSSDSDFARFLHISMASASEFQYQFLLAHDLEYLTKAEYESLNTQIEDIKKMLSSLINTLNT